MIIYDIFYSMIYKATIRKTSQIYNTTIFFKAAIYVCICTNISQLWQKYRYNIKFYSAIFFLPFHLRINLHIQEKSLSYISDGIEIEGSTYYLYT